MNSVLCRFSVAALLVALLPGVVLVRDALAQSETLDPADVICACMKDLHDTASPDTCTDRPPVALDPWHCNIVRELYERGLDPHSAWGRRIYALLGRKHRVTYRLEGTLPLNACVMAFLLDHVPFAAALVNAYQGTRYHARYLDRPRTRFSGGNGDNIAGRFTRVLQTPDRMQTVYFGQGTADILMCKLYGVALILLDLTPQGESVCYRFRCIVFPGSAWLQTVMNFMLFKKIVVGQIEDILEAVQASATAFDRGNRSPIAASVELARPVMRPVLQGFQAVLAQCSGDGAGH